MKSFAAVENSERLSESQRSALISLLADDDGAVYQAVRSKLVSFGPQVTGWLRPYTLSDEPLLRRRAHDIINYFGRQAADERFMFFCGSRGEDLPLEEGAWLLARTQYPDINLDAYEAMLDAFASALRCRVDFSADVEQIIGTINAYLFHELAFTPNEANYYDPENSFLSRVIDSRTGNPISLCTVYLLLARRLKLPITGIGLPGHFVCRYQTSTAEIYIDAFNRGKLLTKADCIKYLLHTHHGLEEGYLAPVSPRRMLLRMCANLHQIYLHNKQTEETARFQRYLVALAK
ncbi:MAG TPA: transglutaminase-like domain-containing protein [Methylomirabilota bacterium]|nr:transglutaminase-like domain-containing protein [Methylomirabilota bacterium]